MFKTITVKNLLSFGPEAEPLPLENLNVLIGPNGSGKSNLLEAIALLRSSPQEKSPLDMRTTITRGGGIGEWIWKGSPYQPGSVEVVVNYPTGKQSIRHLIALRQEGRAISIEDERIENEYPEKGQTDSYFFYRYQGGKPAVNVAGGEKRSLTNQPVDRHLSVLSQLRDPTSYPELSYLSKKHDDISLFREWYFGKRDTPFRRPQKPDLLSSPLNEDFENLPHFLNHISKSPSAKYSLLSAFLNLYEGLTDFGVSFEGGSVQVYFYSTTSG